MYIALMGCAQQASVTPFAASLDVGTLIDLADMSGPQQGTPAVVTFTTSVGALDATVNASGGSGVYTFSWSVSKTNENSDTGNRFSIASTGSTNGATYNTLTIDGARGPNSGDAFSADFEAICTVDDGIATPIDVVVAFRVDAPTF
tara:strand:- start:534 stop:971 length:438 start_codon:yes stop_codon:yes gene_type:complete